MRVKRPSVGCREADVNDPYRSPSAAGGPSDARCWRRLPDVRSIHRLKRGREAARSIRFVSSGTCLARPASSSITRARSCGMKKLAQTSRVSRTARRQLDVRRLAPALDHRAECSPRSCCCCGSPHRPSRARARSAGARPAMNILTRNRLERLEADHEVERRRVLVLIHGLV